MGRLRLLIPGLLIVLLLGFPLGALAQEPGTADKLRALTHEASEGQEAAERGDAAAMRHVYDEIHEGWERVEDAVGKANANGYAAIERAIDKIELVVKADPINGPAAVQAFRSLDQELDQVIARLATGGSAAPIASSPAQILTTLNLAQAAINRGEPVAALAQVELAQVAWPSVEGAIAAKSQADYHAIEDDLSLAFSALKQQPADQNAAGAAIERLRNRLTPYTGTQNYSVFDVAAILLREGLEALLVIVALLTFLRKSGNADKRGWVWGGGAAGVLASIVVAFVLQAIFNSASAGQNRELIEGVTGLVAAAMLFYVSYWLHSHSSMHAWKRYIDERTTQALARGSMLGLALLAFLAVFREGAETTIFYLGMAPSITTQDLLIGLAIGLVTLVVAAVLMLVLGVKLPLRLFFRVAGLLVYYLGFKFVGTGIHSLQVAGILPASPIGLPSLPSAGIYPTWETLLPQLVLILLAVAVFFYLRNQERRVRSSQPLAS